MSERDIVQEIRRCADKADISWPDEFMFPSDLAREAADEIERLKLAIERVGKARDFAIADLRVWSRLHGKVEADRDRLRAAILDIIQTGRREDITAPTALGFILKIASEAVEPNTLP